MNQQKILELVEISRIEGIGPQRLKYLIKATNELDSIFHIESDLLEKIIGVNLVDEFRNRINNFSPELELAKIEKLGSKVFYFEDEAYPQLLKEINDFPPILFVKGNLDLLNSLNKKLAVVGSRKFSLYGREVVDKLIPELILANISIVSGLALGIDALAHQKTLEAGGQAIAVLGSSLDFIYPQENYNLACQIFDKGGLVVSEFPPGTPPLKQHFPRRNRIITGLSDGVLVIEAAKISGSLITARLALDYNRDVFAVPGDITRETAEGTNQLINNGAKLVSSVSDILETWNLSTEVENKPILVKKLSDQEKMLLNLLSGDPIHIDQIYIETKLPASTVSQLISQLELVGVISDVGGGYYKRS